MDGFDVFYPDRMASRILDLGDFKTLIENVQGLSMKKKLVKWLRKWRKQFHLG